MKKILLPLLAMLLVFSAAASLAESEPAVQIEPYLPEASDRPAKMAGGVRAADRKDRVEISGNQYAVLTGENIGIAYIAPGSEVYVLTQDYAQQADLYDMFYNNPIAALLQFYEDGTHMNIYDSASGVDIYIDITSDGWTQLWPDTSAMSSADVNYLMTEFLLSGLNLYAGSYEFGAVGNNDYFIFDCSASRGRVIMYASVGGSEIIITYSAENAAQVTRGLELMASLTIVKMN